MENGLPFKIAACQQKNNWKIYLPPIKPQTIKGYKIMDITFPGYQTRGDDICYLNLPNLLDIITIFQLRYFRKITIFTKLI
jgi:hypothetical protein